MYCTYVDKSKVDEFYTIQYIILNGIRVWNLKSSLCILIYLCIQYI